MVLDKKKKERNALLILTSLLFLNVVGCSSTSTSDSGQKVEKTVVRTGNVALVTGDAEKKVTWHIKEIQRKNSYFNSSLELVEGDSILVRGELIEASRTPWLGVEGPVFELMDSSGNVFERQLIMVEGNAFDFFFSLSRDGSFNSKIQNGRDLLIADPDVKLRSLAGHEISLSDFGEIK